MDGWVIVALTVLAVFLVVGLIHAIFILARKMTEYLDDPASSILGKLIVGILGLFVGIICFILNIFIGILAVWTGYEIAKGTRDWWHRGKRN